jgi:hypothetical protein
MTATSTDKSQLRASNAVVGDAGTRGGAVGQRGTPVKQRLLRGLSTCCWR